MTYNKIPVVGIGVLTVIILTIVFISFQQIHTTNNIIVISGG